MSLPKGTILKGRYRIEGMLGRGGFAITYLATDQQLQIEVAIKEYLPRQLAKRGENQKTVVPYTQDDRKHFVYGLKKFLDEAQAIARFEDHPNIVNVKGYFKENSTAYMVMTYVPGSNFKQYIEEQGGRIPFDTALNIMMPVLDALREVHAAKLLHRDVSPDNIYISTGGKVVLLDFGAARYFASEYSHTLSVMIKSGYAPYEQYHPRGNHGPWTDEYAAAATLYKAITGKTPPDAHDRNDRDTLTPPSKLGVAIPAPAESALLKALAVRPEDRYPSIAEFQQALNWKPPEEASDFVNCQHCGVKNRVPAGLSFAALKCGKCGNSLMQTTSAPPAETSAGKEKAKFIRRLMRGAAAVLAVAVVMHIILVILGGYEYDTIKSLLPDKNLLSIPPSTVIKDSTQPAPPPLKTASAEDSFQRGMAANNQFDKIKNFEKAIEFNPYHAQACYQLAEIFFELRYYERAFNFYNKAISINSQFAKAYGGRGAVQLVWNKNHVEALADFHKALQLDSSLAEVYYNRGRYYFDKKIYQKAMDDFNNAIDKNSSFAEPWFYKGLIYFLQKKYDKADAAFAEAIKKKPDFADAYEYQGITLFTFKVYEAAWKAFDKVIELKPAYADGYYNRARIYHAWKSFINAEKDYNKAISLKPDFADAYYYRGLLYQKTGDQARAREDFQKARKLAPGKYKFPQT